jgi:hypothetical protein
MNRLLLSILVLLMYACGSEEKSAEQAMLESLEAEEESSPQVDEQSLQAILEQIPSPLEVAVLLKEMETNYDPTILNSPDKIANYNSNYEKAMNLGVYGTDLGYTNIYEQNQDALGYLTAIRDLADGLSIGQFFNFGVIKRLATNSRNLDSLLLITTKNFNDINTYLQNQQRTNLSVLLLTGGWIEALHILCQVSEKYPESRALKERIGEQKIIMDQIMLLLSEYGKINPNIKDLEKQMQQLQTVFNDIEITQTYSESKMVEVDGIMMIQNESKTEINITDEHLNDINQITAEIRNSVIK